MERDVKKLIHTPGFLKDLQKFPVAVTFLGTALIFLVNHAFPTFLNGYPETYADFSWYRIWDNSFLTDRYLDRKNYGSFNTRFITANLQYFLHETFAIPFAFSFNLICFLGFWGSSTLLYLFSRQLGIDQRNAYWSILAFYLCFSIILAFGARMWTYDEPMQYLFLLGMLISIIGHRFYLSLMCWFLALLTKETSILFGLIFLFKYPLKQWWRYLIIMLVVAFYFIAIDLILEPEQFEKTSQYFQRSRFNFWQKNFADWNITCLIIFTLYLIVGIPILLVKKFINWKVLSADQKALITCGLVLIVFNSVLVCITALADEARLFALPLLLLWPVLPMAVPALKEKLKKGHTPLRIILFFTLALSLAVFLYHPRVGGTGYLYKGYFTGYTFAFLYLAIPPQQQAPDLLPE